METLTQKYQALEVAVRLRIAAKILEKGITSKYRSEKVLVVKNDQLFNLHGVSYLVEITAHELIDNNGYGYSHLTLPIEQICEIVDNA